MEKYIRGLISTDLIGVSIGIEVAMSTFGGRTKQQRIQGEYVTKNVGACFKPFRLTLVGAAGKYNGRVYGATATAKA